MSSVINGISKAVSAFRSRNYIRAVSELVNSFELMDSDMLLKLDEGLFNALFDAQEITALMAELPVFEKNGFSRNTLDNLKQALLSFTQPNGGTAAALYPVLDDFIMLCKGMNVAMQYLQLKKFRPDDFPPEVSFEITDDGQIRLYAWAEENQSRIAGVSQLKEEFDKLFEKERKSQAYYLQSADELFGNNAYEDCLQLLEHAMTEHEAIKGECFVRKGKILLLLDRYQEALDNFMKARVLGISKQQLSEGIRTACLALLKETDNREQRNSLNSLLSDF